MERRASETLAYAIFSGPFLLHFCSALPCIIYILPSDGHNFQSWSAIILSIGLPSRNSDENRSILEAVFTKHKRHQVQATTDGNFGKKDNQQDYLIFSARRHLTEIQILVRLLHARKPTAYFSSPLQRRWYSHIRTWLTDDYSCGIWSRVNWQ
jgi:hypothetical protein